MSTREEEDAAIRHITEQLWMPEVREDGVYLVAADDRSTILKLCRPDHGSDLLVAGYLVGLQAQKLTGLHPREIKRRVEAKLLEDK